jgi:hypothetical protein
MFHGGTSGAVAAMELYLIHWGQTWVTEAETKRYMEQRWKLHFDSSSVGILPQCQLNGTEFEYL